MSETSQPSLRDRIAAAFKVRSIFAPGVSDQVKRESAEMDYGPQIDAVMAEVQAELDAKDREIERLTDELEDVQAFADESGRQFDKAITERDRQFARAVQAEAERDRLREQQTGLIGQIGRSEIAAAQAREAVERVRKYADEIEIRDYLGIEGSTMAADIRAALDQAPAAEQDGGE